VRRAAAILITALAALAGSADAAVDTAPQVTVIGDSVLTAVEWNPEPLAILKQGVDLRLDVGICRRLTGVSCASEGGPVPTLVDVVGTLGPELGPVVLVEVGYNDDHDTFALNVEQSITALLHAGVQHILWANLHGFGSHWGDMNAVLDAAARRHPELTVIDWNDYAGDHWSWFQNDAIHLRYEGAIAMATLYRRAIDAIVDPVVIDGPPLPSARVGRAYAARFSARGGVGPYQWRMRGPLPKGLSLRPNGTIDGVPKRSGRISIVVSATDSTGLAGTRSETLRIAASSRSAS
jgi:hypothetical protein